MADEITGTAVLDKSGDRERLLCHCLTGDGKSHFANLPVRDRSNPRTQEPEWNYSRNGNMLDVAPSVRLSIPGKELFHNAGSWRVKFVEFPNSGTNIDTAWELFRAVNPDYEL